VCPGCLNHTYREKYDEQIQYLDKLQAKILQNDPWVRKNITEQRDILSISAASTGTAGGESCLASFFPVLQVPLISTLAFDSI
jgi:hypothetical protein